MSRKRTRSAKGEEGGEVDVALKEEEPIVAKKAPSRRSPRGQQLAAEGSPEVEAPSKPKAAPKRRKSAGAAKDSEEEASAKTEEGKEDETAKEEQEDAEAGEASAPPVSAGVAAALGLSAFELERLENIRKNQEYLRSLGLDSTRQEMRAVAVKPKRQSSPKSRPVRKREPREPSRKSGRLEGKDAPNYVDEKVIQEMEAAAEREQEKRMDEGPLTLETLNRSEEGGEGFLQLLHTLVAEAGGKDSEAEAEAEKKPRRSAPKKSTMDYASRLATLSLSEKDIAKLTPSRCTSMVVHPSEDTLVAVTGDVDGHIGVWQVDSPGGSGVFKFKPHISKIASMQYRPHDATQLISASHDGTVRNLDLRKEVFDLIIASGGGFDDSGFTCAHASAASPHSLLLAGHEGSIGMVDLRNKQLAWVATGHDKKTNSIEAHPLQEFMFVSSSTDRTVKLWDSRKIKKPLFTIAHTNSINNTTFNPTGNLMLTTCQDHKLYVFEDALTALKGDVAPSDAKYIIKHNNNTGRWLSKFWPHWDPKEPTAFVIGSLEQPRRIEVFSAEAGFQIASVQSEFMNSVQSINVFHPTLNVLVGANSSGRTHVYRGK